MLSDREFQELVEDLYTKDISMRVAALRTLCEEPSEDERILPHLEALLTDTTPCVVMLPYRFGEIRWLAAHALAAELTRLGRSKPIRLQGVVRPLDTEEFVAIRDSAGIKGRGGVDNVLETLPTLYEMGRLPLYDLELVPAPKKKSLSNQKTIVASFNSNGNKAYPRNTTTDTRKNLAFPTVTTASRENSPDVDFSSDPNVVWAVAEGERLTYGYLFNPTFATETSLIEPLPHQRIAVYDYLLKQPRLRFLLADDAGAGKTIMTGLYIREMLSRRLIRRVLIVPPAGLVGNWEREMKTLFRLPFRIATGSEARSGNPFKGSKSDLLIVSVDTLAGERMFSRLQDSTVVPYDLVVFDEAHKLSADREPDFYIRKTNRYKLAEALVGIETEDPQWKLSWRCQHLLLLTATPHMGKDFPYYCLWRLLEPEVLSTYDAFSAYPVSARKRHFIRRTKEEMVRFDGSPIYPMRISDTLSYELTQGAVSEQTLYDETTHYIQFYYNRARILNRSAARLAMSVFQRRLASSTYGLIQSFKRRSEKLDRLIEDIQSGRISLEELRSRQQRLDKSSQDILLDKTADEEEAVNGLEENEIAQDNTLGGVAVVSLEELKAEQQQVQHLLELATNVYEIGEESKFEKLRELINNPHYKNEKIIIFTEHRDTLEFLVRRLEGMGFTGQVAQLHGGMPYQEREEQVEFFRKPASEGGAIYLVATDAAGEGINLQFCWLMINYDIPWNPARLEQRMGRIHRYGQKHDPVIVMNLVAGKTREGRVLKTLLDKLERIRKELSSDKVFDVVGRIFEGISIKNYLEQAITEEGAIQVQQQIETQLTREKVEELRKQEKSLFGDAGDVRSHLPQLKAQIEREQLRRLLPGYVRYFIEKAAPLIGIGIEGDLDSYFSFIAHQPGALDWLWPILESYPEELRSRLTVYKPNNKEEGIFLHPGEPVFDRFREYICNRFAEAALKGGVFVDPNAQEPYLFHLTLISIIQKADSTQQLLAGEEILECKLIGLSQTSDGKIKPVSAEQLTVLKGRKGIPPLAIPLVAQAKGSCELIQTYASEQIARSLVDQRCEALLATLPEKLDFLRRGYDYQEAELAAARAKLRDKANAGDSHAKGEMTKIKNRQRQIASLKEEAIASLRREPELIVPGEVTCLAHALVVPSTDPEDKKRHDREIEAIAVRVAIAYEQANGATVEDVSVPEKACAAGLTDYPGFDLLSHYPEEQQRAIEVKGRAGISNVEMTENEWVSACNLRDRYWLYVVFDCASSHPRLLRIQDPFGKLIVKTKTNVVIDSQSIFQTAEIE